MRCLGSWWPCKVRPRSSKRYRTNLYGSFYDTTDQTADSTTESYPLHLNTTVVSHGVEIENDGDGHPSKIYLADGGVFNIQFSGQIHSTNASTKTLEVWLSKNGVDEPDSNTHLTLSGSGTYTVAAWNWVVEANKKDYFQIKWLVSNTNVVWETLPAGTSPTRPEVPSLIVTVTEVG